MRSIWPGFGDTGLRLSRSSAENRVTSSKQNRVETRTYRKITYVHVTASDYTVKQSDRSFSMVPNGFALPDRVICNEKL